MTTLQVQKNDIIRAYDFKPMTGRDDCYIEGRVLEVNNVENGYQAYKIEVTRDSWEPEGSQGRKGMVMFVPWKVSFSEFQGRIMNLSR